MIVGNNSLVTRSTRLLERVLESEEGDREGVMYAGQVAVGWLRCTIKYVLHGFLRVPLRFRLPSFSYLRCFLACSFSPPFTLTEGGDWMLIAEGKLEDFVENLPFLLFLLLGEAGSSHYIFWRIEIRVS